MSESTDVPMIPLRRRGQAEAPTAADGDAQRAPEAESAGVYVSPAGQMIDVPLEGVFLEWVQARAAAHGEPPGDHIARLLRQCWQTDPWRVGGAKG